MGLMAPAPAFGEATRARYATKLMFELSLPTGTRFVARSSLSAVID
jgi:hypothetical protein